MNCVTIAKSFMIVYESSQYLFFVNLFSCLIMPVAIVKA